MGAALELMQRWFAKPDHSLYADDVDFVVPGYPVPHERYHGRKAVAEEFFPALRSHFSLWRAEPSEFIEAGDRVTVIGKYVATTTAGTDLVIPFIHVWTVRNGAIASAVAAVDSAHFRRAGIGT
jgi:ketosteroid isomerase-like protein